MIFTKIHIHNTESFQNNSKLKLNKKPKFGVSFIPILVASAVIAINSEMMQVNARKDQSPQIPIPSTVITMNVDLDKVNGMNVILNDDDCSDIFFQDVVDYLQSDGIEVTTARDGDIINQDNATIITLDQQYNAGDSTLIFAPYNNARVGHSDSLALSMQTAFQQNGVQVDDILCGKVGYQEDQDGNVHYVVETDTESIMDEDCDSSFVTISLGTEVQDAEQVAKSIENGLARQNIYLESDDNQTDLIYRANSLDSIDGVADYFGTDSSRLRNYNGMKSDEFRDSQTVINPYVEDMRAFDSTRDVQLTRENTKSY